MKKRSNCSFKKLFKMLSRPTSRDMSKAEAKEDLLSGRSRSKDHHQRSYLSISKMNSEKYPRSSIEDDFNYGTNVATASVQIRMGEYIGNVD